MLYVWFDAPDRVYLCHERPDSGMGKILERPGARMIHFIRKDNIVFIVLFSPAMLKADGSYILPDNVPANEFLIWKEIKFPHPELGGMVARVSRGVPGKQDVLRYVLTANAPETKDNDFTWKDFQTRNNSELVAISGTSLTVRWC